MKPPGNWSGGTDLSQLQRWFQSVITSSEGVEAAIDSSEAQALISLKPGELETVVTRSRALSAAERVGIYANAYYTRLFECLGEVFPMVKRTLGEDGFNALAFGYLQVYPSRSYTLNELGRHFPDYLEKTKPCADTDEETDISPGTEATDALSHPDWAEFLIDLARLEWGIYEVFDGEGVEGKALLTADQVLAIPAELWPDARLNTVPCLQLLATGFPVNDYYTALRRHTVEEPLPIPGRAPSYVAITRRNFVVRRYNFSRAEFELLQALKSDATISQALESMLSRTKMDVADLPEKLKLWFRNWTAEDFFESIS